MTSSKIQSRMEELESLTIDNRERIGRRTGVPFIVFTYDPKDELSVDDTVEAYVKKLRNRGQSVERIDMRDLVFTLLEEERILDAVIEKEQANEGELREGLSSVLLGGRTDEQGLIAETIKDRIDDVDTAVVYRTGVLYPFAGISSILMQLENEIETPFVVFYPAVKEDKSLKFLDKTEGTYYRARVI
ncbi:hypothetical protein BB347_09375 [Natronorubrum daqingense]|uniref:DUF1788 domain-containing protein n=2 Tax=Natronorubrum daqingense TaxID=588898 RepID=A0A1P8RDS6_9EURY|nr:hypothetical protein BB347_09375 [Natronorubrum daqingense]